MDCSCLLCKRTSVADICDSCKKQTSTCTIWLNKAGRPKKVGFHKDVGEWVATKTTKHSQSVEDVRLQAILSPWEHANRDDRPLGEWDGVYEGFVPSLLLSLYFQVTKDERFLSSLATIEDKFTEYAKQANLIVGTDSDCKQVHPFRIKIWNKLFSENGMDLTAVIKESFDRHKVDVIFDDDIFQCSIKFCSGFLTLENGSAPARSAKYMGTFWPGKFAEKILKDCLPEFLENLDIMKKRNPRHLEGFNQTPVTQQRRAPKRKLVAKQENKKNLEAVAFVDIENNIDNIGNLSPDFLLGSLNSQESPDRARRQTSSLVVVASPTTRSRSKLEAFGSPVATTVSRQQQGIYYEVQTFGDILRYLGFYPGAQSPIDPMFRFKDEQSQKNYFEICRCLETDIPSAHFQAKMWGILFIRNPDPVFKGWYEARKDIPQLDMFNQYIGEFLTVV